MTKRKILGLLFLAQIVSIGVPGAGLFERHWSMAALADDDDNGDNGGAGARSGGGGGRPDSIIRGGGRSIFDRFLPPRRSSRPARPRPLEQRAPDELVAISAGDTEIATLLARGYVVLEQHDLPVLAARIVRLRIPPGLSLDAARDDVAALVGEQSVDFNHFYRGEAQGDEPAGCTGNHCRSLELVAWPLEGSRPKRCAADLSIGMIDTGINPDHATFAGRRIELLSTATQDRDGSRLLHGTAVAALLVGSADSRTPGLVPDATLIAVDAFHRDGNDERSDAYALIRALDMLSERQVNAINLSLAGPANRILEGIVDRLDRQGVVLVAAAGNGGPRAQPLFPAAYGSVIAVTAVNARRRIYRRAVQGDHIDFAAPGVNVWSAASIRGARPKTGTSFAAPFVTAALAIARAQAPDEARASLVGGLATQAVDLGKPGRDPVFGHGLIQIEAICRN